ncbi:RmlC-like cupins superfamily protein [Euphorbia peplus]|nr:RmlC-like cupins superfamily protein [Euphorbia peplus]
MKVSINFLVFNVGILALASTFAIAYDPSPLQDFCVATNDTSFSFFVNGMFCKDPEKVTVEDFTFSGFNIRRNTSEQLGVYVTLLDVSMMPGLNTNGLSLARIDFAPNGGLNPPHTHPRAAEILTVLEGTVYAGFVGTNPDHRLFAKVLHPGDVIIFPFGLIHFQMNIGETPAVAIAALTSQDPGVMTIANAAFGSEPAMDARVLAKAFHLDESLVTKLQKEEWVNPSY